jgi:hypothetical protein
MQILLAVLGKKIVSGGEVILQIHLEVAMLRSFLTKEGIGYVSLLGVVSHKLLFHGS